MQIVLVYLLSVYQLCFLLTINFLLNSSLVLIQNAHKILLVAH